MKSRALVTKPKMPRAYCACPFCADVKILTLRNLRRELEDVHGRNKNT